MKEDKGDFTKIFAASSASMFDAITSDYFYSLWKKNEIKKRQNGETQIFHPNHILFISIWAGCEVAQLCTFLDFLINQCLLNTVY